MEERTISNRERNILIGLRIRDARMQRGLSLEQLADQAGMSVSHLSNVEHGLKALSIDFLVNIAEVLDVSIDYLLTGRLWTGWGMSSSLRFRSDSELLTVVSDGKAGQDGDSWQKV